MGKNDNFFIKQSSVLINVQKIVKGILCSNGRFDLSTNISIYGDSISANIGFDPPTSKLYKVIQADAIVNLYVYANNIAQMILDDDEELSKEQEKEYNQLVYNAYSYSIS